MLDALAHAPFDLAGDEHRACIAREALYTALEHEAMHQETLLYMWHRLPHAQKQAARGVRYELGRRAAAARERSRIPAGRATLGADARRIPFGWDNEFDAHTVRRAGLRDRRAQRDQRRRSSSSSRRAAIERGAVDRADWEWRETTSVAHPTFWVRDGAEWFWRGMFEDMPLPPSWPVYVSQAEAVGVRALEGTPASDRSGVPSRRVRHAGRARSGRFPGATRRRTPTRGNFDFPGWEPVPAGVAPGRRQRVGRARSGRQRLGVDLDGLRTVPRVRADGVVPGVLGRLLRRPALRHEGGVAGDRARADPPELPQLVPPELPVRLRDVPLRRPSVRT